ncbi:Rieske (2Fe-2S) protein [Nocardioides dubius]|uniref:Rieske (2Fe-2S) protein n=1 Tax=Nocardioides dubius TaxID=317019 RepID=A0ABN1TMC5_9ACTN
MIGRRTTFKGLGALGVALVLAGCGSDDDRGGPSAEAGEVLATTSEVPVGGGLVLADKKIVLTRPTAGEFLAFSAICTHQSGELSVTDEGLHCSLHGSVFSIDDGSVVRAPATDPLPTVAITVEGDQILAA